MLLQGLFKDRFYLAPEKGAADAVADDDASDATDDVVDASAKADESESEADASAEPEAEESAEPVAPEPAASPYAELKQYGLPDDPKVLATQWQQLQRHSQEAEQYRNQLLWILHQQQQQQAAAQQKPAEPAKPKLPWEIPEYKREWLDLVTRDENGNLVAKPGAMPDLPQKINAYASAREQAIDQLLRDPYGVLQGGMQDFVQQQAAQIAQQYVVQYAEQNYLAQETEKNREWALDAAGNLTPAGQRWSAYYQQFRQQGMPHWQAGAAAHKSLNGDLYEYTLSQEAAKPQPAPKTHAQKQVDALRKANAPNRNGTLPRSGKRVSQHKDPFREFADGLKELPEEDYAISR